ncbi:MAG: AAA family ATPase [Paludibacteraceae bacterium]
MITRIEIDGFKSFKNFSMEFTPFTVIAGINASGKSNLFDALELLSRLSVMELRDAFPDTRGTVNELFTLIDEDTYVDTMSFAVEMLVERKVKDNWGLDAEIKSPRLRYELKIERKKNSRGFDELSISHEYLNKISTDEDIWSKTFIPRQKQNLWKSTQKGGSSNPFINTETLNGLPSIYIRQDGGQGGKATPARTVSQTVLSGVNSVDFPHVFAAKEEMRNWRFMQLNPEDLRQPTKQDAKMSYEITHSGANLASALFRMKEDDDYILVEIGRELIKFLPEYVGVNVVNDEANKQFIIKLKHKDGKEFSSRVLSEGTLRLLALTIMQFDERHRGLLCFEEPENGIHPQRIKLMAELLYNLSADFENDDMPLRQVIVNTHSPLLVREMLNIRGTNTNSVWLSKMTTLITEINGKRLKIKNTQIHPVSFISEYTLFQPTQMSIADLDNYLNTLKDEPELID